MVYGLIASEGMSSSTKATFFFVFDIKNNRFIDIDFHPPSIHARVDWESLTIEHREYLLTLLNYDDFFESDFSKFIDSIIQLLVIGIVTRNVGLIEKSYKKITLNQLPKFITNKKRLEVFPEPLIQIPHDVSISRVTEDEPFIKFLSKYGDLVFSWSMGFAMFQTDSKPFIEFGHEYGDEDICEIVVNVECKSQINYWRIFSGESSIFFDWAEKVQSYLQTMCWDQSKENYLIFLMKKIHESTVNNKI
ncbi:hypothetical protein FCL47_23345 [Desulfopila sp. IMCC35006]|uniref:hypothetical protein n=1 Tax=Desulfopila sp. IMCC35006 TaxID=2569542 RepID=UPI0010ABAAA4|nr:hypothetical protein [Desulfopila sp. IMCC35006]TKB23295.1 hypothetical protein FCL47_23345 [Desulfopila sp. IMCC35006]